MSSGNYYFWCSAKNKLKLATNFMKKLNAVTSIMALVVLTSCSKKDAGSTNSSQATMNVQEAKSDVKEIPYKSEIERGLTLQFDYMSIPQGTIETLVNLFGGKELLVNGTTQPDPDAYMAFLFAIQTNGLIAIEKMQEDGGQKSYNVKWTPKALGLRDEKYSTANVLRIPLGACEVKTIVKDIEYHNPNLSQSDDFRLAVGTYELKPNDFGKSQGATDGVFKFRAVVKLNPFNQTYSYVSGDWGTIDADGWQTHNVSQ